MPSITRGLLPVYKAIDENRKCHGQEGGGNEVDALLRDESVPDHEYIGDKTIVKVGIDPTFFD